MLNTNRNWKKARQKPQITNTYGTQEDKKTERCCRNWKMVKQGHQIQTSLRRCTWKMSTIGQYWLSVPFTKTGTWKWENYKNLKDTWVYFIDRKRKSQSMQLLYTKETSASQNVDFSFKFLSSRESKMMFTFASPWPYLNQCLVCQLENKLRQAHQGSLNVLTRT